VEQVVGDRLESERAGLSLENTRFRVLGTMNPLVLPMSWAALSATLIQVRLPLGFGRNINAKALQFKPGACRRACRRGASEVGGSTSTHNTAKALIIYILKHVSHSAEATRRVLINAIMLHVTSSALCSAVRKTASSLTSEQRT